MDETAFAQLPQRDHARNSAAAAFDAHVQAVAYPQRINTANKSVDNSLRLANRLIFVCPAYEFLRVAGPPANRVVWE